MLYHDYNWFWLEKDAKPREPGLYLVWRGDVESAPNNRGLIQVYIIKQDIGPDKVYWTSTDPNGNDTIGDFSDWPESYKLAKVGE